MACNIMEETHKKTNWHSE